MSVSRQPNMNKPRAYSSENSQYAAPADIPPSLWVFPPALDRTFVSKFNVELPPSNKTTSGEDNKPYLEPPLPFSEEWKDSDVLLQSIYNLTYTQRAGPSAEEDFRRFGNNKATVHTSDSITLDWEGGDEKVVRMICHLCSESSDSPDNILSTCERSRRPYT
jgi:hypothetical protein